MIKWVKSVLLDKFSRRMFLWLIVAALTVWLMHHFYIAFPYDRMYLLFAPKVPFLGLIIAAATFQYRVWRELLDRDEKRITDPQWIQFERQLADLQRRVEVAKTGVAPMPTETLHISTWEAILTQRKKECAEIAQGMLQGIFPHNVAILGNFLFIGVCLLLSSTADAALFLVRHDVAWLREISSALFIVVLLPFLENAGRYFIALGAEFRSDRRWFQEQREQALRESK